GAVLPRCNWGIGYEEGLYTRLPHVNAARMLSSLVGLRARLRFEEGRGSEAIDDIMAAMSLGRHVGREGSLIVVLVGNEIELRTMVPLASYLATLDAGLIKALERRLGALPPPESLATALRTVEKETLDWFVRKVREAKDQQSVLALLGWIGVEEGKSRDSAAS